MLIISSTVAAHQNPKYKLFLLQSALLLFLLLIATLTLNPLSHKTVSDMPGFCPNACVLVSAMSSATAVKQSSYLVLHPPPSSYRV